MLCQTITEFERQEGRERRARARELASKGVEIWQIAERLGANDHLVRSWTRDVRRGA